MHRYRLSGVALASDITLRCPDADASEPASDLTSTMQLRLGRPDEAPPRPSRWVDRDSGLTVGAFERGYVVRRPDYADFVLDRGGAEVVVFPVFADCPVETIEQVFLDQVFPLVLHARGRFALHAGSVALEGLGAIAFAGDSGLGKSTLASSFAREHDAALFSDDCLALESARGGVVAYPSYPSSRLWPEVASQLFAERGELPFASSRTVKRRVALPHGTAPAPLRRIYLIERGEGPPALVRLRPAEALARLASHLYRLDATDKTRLAQELALLGDVVASVPVARLLYARDLARLSEVHAAIRADLSAPSS